MAASPSSFDGAGIAPAARRHLRDGQEPPARRSIRIAARGWAPENKRAAFAKALMDDVTTLELDLAITTDGVAEV